LARPLRQKENRVSKSECMPKSMYRVKKVEYLDGYRLKLRFNNGQKRIIDLSGELKNAKNKFLDLVDLSYFKKVECDGITILWPNGIDFCPEWLFMNSKEVNQTPKKRPAGRAFRRRNSRMKAF
jgi:hypothetical protein